MELLIIIGILAGLIILYFCLGIAFKFIWGWWIMVIATPLCIFVGLAFGWLGAIGGIIGFFVALGANNEWHGTAYYLSISRKIDKGFYFGDT